MKWRNRTYRLRFGGLAEEIVDSKKNVESKPSISNIESAPQIMAASPQSAAADQIKSTNLASFNTAFINSKSTTFNQSHKRTSSHSINSSSFNNNKMGFNGSHYGSNSDLHRGSQASLSGTTTRSHHQQHHSISSPITSAGLLHPSNSSMTLIDLNGTSKPPDLKII